MPDPLILTARFEPETQAYFQATRDDHFPADLNIVPAHLTLFHKLPGERFSDVIEAVHNLCAGLDPLPATVADLRFFGRGGAFVIRSEGLDDLRSSLQQRLLRDLNIDLSAQDRQPHRPHVTYQNKTTKAHAERSYAAVLGDFSPFETQIVALDLWWYRRHWDAAGSVEF